MNTEDTLATKEQRIEFLKLACDKSTLRRDIQRIKLERLRLEQKRENAQDCPHCYESLLVVDGSVAIDDGSYVGQNMVDQIEAVEALISELNVAMEQDDIHYQAALGDYNALWNREVAS